MATTLPDLPVLKILPIASLLVHEDHDRQRTQPLVEKLRAQGILRNPPVVMPLTDNSGRSMVLDGANRVTALETMEFPHIVAQVVPPDDPNVLMQTWNHVIWGIPAEDLLVEIERKIELTRLPPGSPPAESGRPSLRIHLADGRVLETKASPGRIDVESLHQVVDAYKDRAHLDRTNQSRVEAFREVHEDLTGLVIFPHMDVKDVLELTGQGSLLPTGITRFVISPRALHLNYPLHELSSSKPVDYKQAYLNRWVQERIKNKNVRYYSEATFLYDE